MTAATAAGALPIGGFGWQRAPFTLRTVQLQVPDTRVQGFVEECRRQSRLIAAAYPTEDDLAWERITEEAMADMEDWVA